MLVSHIDNLAAKMYYHCIKYTKTKGLEQKNRSKSLCIMCGERILFVKVDMGSESKYRVGFDKCANYLKKREVFVNGKTEDDAHRNLSG